MINFKETIRDTMNDNANTTLYIVAGIIVLHFVVGFLWIVNKLTKKKDD